MKTCVVLGMCMILCALAMISQGCKNDDGMTKDKPHTIIVPGVVECQGHVDVEYFGNPGSSRTKLPVLVCDDGRVFHNVANYQDVIELKPVSNTLKSCIEQCWRFGMNSDIKKCQDECFK